MSFNKKNHFLMGIEGLEMFSYTDAKRNFYKSYKGQKNKKGYDYLLYTNLIFSRYLDLYKIVNSINPEAFGGFGLYTLYWYRLMTGDTKYTKDYLIRLLDDENYFLKVYAVKELIRRKETKDIKSIIIDKIKGIKVIYVMHWEEMRAKYLVEYIKGNYETAMRECRALVVKFPLLGDLYLDLIDIAVKFGNPDIIDKTLFEVSQAQVAGNDPRINLSLSREYYNIYNYDRSIYYMKAVMKVFKKNPLLYYNLGNAYYLKKDYVNAVVNYEKAITFNPCFERAYYNAGTVYFKLGELDDAISRFDESLKLSNKPDSIYNLSLSLIEKKELTDAYYCLDKIPMSYSERYRPDEIQRRIKNLIFQST